MYWTVATLSLFASTYSFVIPCPVLFRVGYFKSDWQCQQRKPLSGPQVTVDCSPVLLPPIMASPQVHQLHVGPITAFSFNADRSKVAISPNSNDVDIYLKKGPGFTKVDTLPDVHPHNAFYANNSTINLSLALTGLQNLIESLLVPKTYLSFVLSR